MERSWEVMSYKHAYMYIHTYGWPIDILTCMSRGNSHVHELLVWKPPASVVMWLVQPRSHLGATPVAIEGV